MHDFFKTPVAARRLGVSYHRLINLLRFHKIHSPARDSSGDFVWSLADLERARLALEGRGVHTAAAPAAT